MSFIPINNCILGEIVAVLFDQTVEITSHWLLEDSLTESLLASVAHRLYANFANHVLDQLSEDVYLVEGRATSEESESAPVGIYIPTSFEQGSITAASFPGNAALVITKRTPLRGRSYRGRNYLYGVPTSKVTSGDSNEALTSWVEDVLDAYADFVVDMAIDIPGIQEVVASRYHDNAPRVSGVATVITAYSANTEIDSQRRRLTGRGT